MARISEGWNILRKGRLREDGPSEEGFYYAWTASREIYRLRYDATTGLWWTEDEKGTVEVLAWKE